MISKNVDNKRKSKNLLNMRLPLKYEADFLRCSDQNKSKERQDKRMIHALYDDLAVSRFLLLQIRLYSLLGDRNGRTLFLRRTTAWHRANEHVVEEV